MDDKLLVYTWSHFISTCFQPLASLWLLDDFTFCLTLSDYRMLSVLPDHRPLPPTEQNAVTLLDQINRSGAWEERCQDKRKWPLAALPEFGWRSSKPTLSRWQVGRNESETSVIDRVRFWWYRGRSLRETTIVHRLIESERYRLSRNHALDRNASVFVGAENSSVPDQDQIPYHDWWR